MSFAAKTDYIGLELSGLVLRANSQNASNSVLEIVGSDGSIIGDEITGHIKAPNCEYALSATTTFSGISLGTAYNPPYALSRLHISTGAGAEPTVTADAVQIEAGATRSVCVYPIDTVSVSPARHALTFGAFTYTETEDLVLQSSEFDATCNLTPTTINNNPIASDATGGKETVDVTFWKSSETQVPAVTVASGWHITSDWTCTGSDGAMFTWTATFTKYLTASMAD